MLKFPIFANQFMILMLKLPLVSYARSAGAIGILSYWVPRSPGLEGSCADGFGPLVDG